MRYMSRNTALHSSFLGLGLLIVFVIAVLGCSSGLMPSIPTMHSDDMACSDMFSDMFIVSHKELGAMLYVAPFAGMLLMLVVWSASFLLFLKYQYHIARILQRARSTLIRLHEYSLEQFSAGILHPKTY